MYGQKQGPVAAFKTLISGKESSLNRAKKA